MKHTVYPTWIFILFFLVSYIQAEDNQDIDEKVQSLSQEVESLFTAFQSQTENLSRVRIWGDVRLRLKNTDLSDVSNPVGIYGETLDKGSNLNHRMVLEIEARVTDKLSAGGMIRLSNEDKIVFDTGPEHLSNDRGSVFVKYNPGDLFTTFGYYDIHFTPLTIMRWDSEDNPEGGGKSSCACLSEGGAVTSQSLEELGPDLIFEGGKINTSIGDNIDAVALFARPRIAQEGKTFQQYLYGANMRFLGYHKPTNSFRWVGLKAISINDDEESIYDPSRIIYAPISSQIYSLDFNLPVMRTLLFKGEIALSISSDSEENDQAIWGKAAILGMSVNFPEHLRTNIAYLRLDPDYESLYKALSYESNRQGFRASTSYEIIKDKFSLWLFYKWLKELESAIKNEPDLLKTQSTISPGISITPLKNVTLQSSYILEFLKRDKSTNLKELNTLKHSVNAEIIYNMARQNSISFKYQYLMNRDRINKEADYNARIASIMVSSKF